MLWPQGSSVETVPADFVFVLDHALTILNWMENLPSDEMPPTWMWPLDWEIEAHFNKVKIARDKKYGKTDDDRDTDQTEENAYASRFK